MKEVDELDEEIEEEITAEATAQEITWLDSEPTWRPRLGGASGHVWRAVKLLGKGAFGKVALWQRERLQNVGIGTMLFYLCSLTSKHFSR